MEYNLSDIEWNWYWDQSKLIKWSDKGELELCNKIQLWNWIEWIDWILINWMWIKLIWNNECKCNSLKSYVIGSWIIEWKSI